VFTWWDTIFELYTSIKLRFFTIISIVDPICHSTDEDNKQNENNRLCHLMHFSENHTESKKRTKRKYLPMDIEVSLTKKKIKGLK